MFGWTACVAGIGGSLIVAALLAVFLKTPITLRGDRAVAGFLLINRDR
jgi:hypothetical protein